MVTSASASMTLVRASVASTKASGTVASAGTKPADTIASVQPTPNNGAQAASSIKPDWDYYNSLTNVGTTQEEFVRLKTEGGRKLSQSQGLPEGHYDFSQMSRSEMDVALNDIILNNRAPQSVIDGLTIIANTAPENKGDLFTQAKDSMDFEANLKNTATANLLKSALDYMSADKALFESTKDARMSKASSSYQSALNS